MIVTPHFVFLHLHKSGGTFVNHILTSIFPESVSCGYHAPHTSIPKQFAHLPIVGTIRNPWSYYVSWYFFQKGRRQQNVLFQIASDDGTLSFEQTIANLAQLGMQTLRFQRLSRDLPTDLPNRGLNLNKSAITNMEGYTGGFYSYLVEHMYGNLDGIRIMKMENLREELLCVLREFNIEPNDSVIELINTEKKRNTSSHDSYSQYYDNETRELIARRDSEIIERFGYSFGS